MVITQIVPQLPPAIDGLGDYALNLARQLRKDFGIETHFIIGKSTWAGAMEIEGFSISQVNMNSAAALLSLLPCDSQRPSTVLLHYVGYGYAKRGCPFWLVDGLQRWRIANPHQTLVIMFHELYAYNRPPWTSAFWLLPLQKNLATRLVRLSDRCLTSKQVYAKMLQELSLGKHVQIPTLAVFSNIGEPERIPALADRDRRIVVFGSPSNRLRVYQESFAKLSHTCKLLEIQEIWDIGQPMTISLSDVNGIPIVEMGQRTASEISNIMLNSLGGFFDYHPDFLAKSGIFAAYCAHGLLPISAQLSANSVDEIESGKHYWIPDVQTTSLKNFSQLQAIASNAYRWYQNHNLSVHAQTFAVQLSKNIVTQR